MNLREAQDFRSQLNAKAISNEINRMILRVSTYEDEVGGDEEKPRGTKGMPGESHKRKAALMLNVKRSTIKMKTTDFHVGVADGIRVRTSERAPCTNIAFSGVTNWEGQVLGWRFGMSGGFW
ncbi:hypothetical protein NL676_001196 [Syzygium grande]|nr:hypothetical protein NL676_001196 [Syzygium grande]